jgi:low temperature requirement protein LtrA
VVWWVYFAFIPSVTEHTLEHARGGQRSRAARDLFTFGHFPIVVGIVGYAVVAKHMVAAPGSELSDADGWLLICAFAILIGGCLNIQWHVRRRLAIERFVAVAVIAVLVLVGGSLAGWAVVSGIAGILAIMQSITWRRFRLLSLNEVARSS